MNIDLTGARVLIAEDDALVGLELALCVTAAGGEVLGPVSTVAGADKLADAGDLDAAILDARLHDGVIYPVLDRLLARGTAVVLHSGTASPIVARGVYPSVPVFPKPARPAWLLASLTEQLRRHPEPARPHG